MIQKTFRDNAISAVQIQCGTNASKVVKNPLKVIHILEGLQHAEPENAECERAAINKDWQLTG